MGTLNLLYKKEHPINEFISVRIPSVGEILECEDEYYGLVSMITAMPIDMMVQLDDIGVDFTTINEWELFLLLFGSIKERDTSLIFGDLSLSQFQPAINAQNNTVMLIDKSTGAKIDRAIHGQIANILRKIHHHSLDQHRCAPDDPDIDPGHRPERTEGGDPHQTGHQAQHHAKRDGDRPDPNGNQRSRNQIGQRCLEYLKHFLPTSHLLR